MGVYFILFFDKKLIFDKQLGVYYSGSYNPHKKALKGKRYVKLKEIFALQLISEFVKGSTNSRNVSFYSYELNLILENGKRLNVIDHGDFKNLEKDAHLLADFLNIPVLNYSQIPKIN